MIIISNTTIRISLLDRLRILLGRRLQLSTEIEVSQAVDIVASSSTANVEPMWPSSQVQLSAYDHPGTQG